MKHKELTRVEVAEKSVILYGKPLDLSGYKPFHKVYNHDWQPKTLLMTGRQVSKSTTLSILTVLAAAFIPYYRILYCVPSETQMYKFSNLYVKPLLKNSPVLSRLIDKDTLNSVKVREFAKGGRIEFSYTSGGGDRIRGTSSDEISWDEVQDTDYDCIPVVEQCISASNWGFQRFSGTPKSMDNTIQKLWERTSQNEWVMKCDACNHWNIPILPQVYEMLGKEGPVCTKCKKPLDVTKGEWISHNPGQSGFFEGFHVPQFIIPSNLTPKRWREIMEQYHVYSPAKFANEVLGLSYDLGGKLITLTELKENMHLESNFCYSRQNYPYVVAGVDWGISSESSYTVLVIIGIRSNGYGDVVYHKKFLERDPLKCVTEIAGTLKGYAVDMVGCDFGVGYTNNQLLRKEFYLDRVQEFQYSNQKRIISYNSKVHRFIINRTSTMNLLYIDLKKGMLSFKKDKLVETEVFSDLLAPYEEEKESSSGGGSVKVFRKPIGKTDDFTHAINFAILASKLLKGEMIISYDKNDDLI